LKNYDIEIIVNMKKWIINVLIAILFLWSLQQGCVGYKPGAKSNIKPIENLISKTVYLTSVVRLPEKLDESSGIAMTTSGKIWSHNDSGNKKKLYCFDTNGTMLRDISITNAKNVDWEDLAMDSQKNLYICDVGNNNNKRNNQTIYRIPDPESFDQDTLSAEIIRFSFEDQSEYPPSQSERQYDIEAVIWHNDSLFLFSKDRTTPFSGYTKMYKIPALPGTHVAKYAGSRYLGNSISSARVTSADIHPESGKLVLLVNNRLIVFSDYPGNRFFEGKVTEYPFAKLPGQVEAILFQSETKLYMTEEGIGGTPGFLYEIILPLK